MENGNFEVRTDPGVLWADSLTIMLGARGLTIALLGIYALFREGEQLRFAAAYLLYIMHYALFNAIGFTQLSID